MSYKQMTGNIISATKVEPDGNLIINSASGVWSLQEAFDYTKGDNWPNQANLASRGIVAGGETTAGALLNVIEYISIEVTGNTTDFGDLATAARMSAGTSSSTRGIINGGRGSGGGINEIQYITIASTGDATDFGDLSQALLQLAGCSSSTRGIVMGGY